MIKCNDCEDCYVNTNSDEAYCEANDGEQIILHKGQCRPRWCPHNIHGKHADFMKIDEAVKRQWEKMIERRHEIIKQLISEWEQCESMLDVQNLFVVALTFASECIGYIDAIKSGEGERRENEND